MQDPGEDANKYYPCIYPDSLKNFFLLILLNRFSCFRGNFASSNF